MSTMIHPIITWQEIGQLQNLKRTASWTIIRQIRDCYDGSAKLKRKGAVLTKDFAEWVGLDISDVYAFISVCRCSQNS